MEATASVPTTSYDSLLSHIQARFAAAVADGKEPLFTTDADGDALWSAYLDSFADPSDRQYHNCHACRRFVQRFGGLVAIDETGRTSPALWMAEMSPEEYGPAVAALAKLVRRSKVAGVFLSSERTWGTPITGEWRHFAVTPPASMIHSRPTQTAGQLAAEKKEDFGAVSRALAEFPANHVELALSLLRSDVLYRSEKVLGQAEWLHALHVARDAAHGGNKDNVVWRAVAKAPAGFCHPRTSMIGTLLEDIAAGMDFGEVSRRFRAKMHPLAYQRPQAAPSAGAVAEAERIVRELGAAGSLARRYARLDDVRAIWRPKADETDRTETNGVFGHLKIKESTPDAAAFSVPPQTMTWEKFARVVLPTADRIELRAPGIGPYTSLVTAVNPDAPPIIQWDSPDARNPVSWYFWHNGSPAGQFGLTAGKFTRVDAVALKPSMWGGGQEHHGEGVLFVLNGAADSRKEGAGAAIFPEFLKAEFRAIRTVIEAYSRSATIADADKQSAAGIMLNKGSEWDAHLRVWTGGRSSDYRLDRWD